MSIIEKAQMTKSKILSYSLKYPYGDQANIFINISKRYTAVKAKLTLIKLKSNNFNYNICKCKLIIYYSANY